MVIIYSQLLDHDSETVYQFIYMIHHITWRRRTQAVNGLCIREITLEYQL